MSSKNQSARKKIIHWLLGVLLLFLFGLIAFIAVYTPKYISTQLSNYVSVATRQEYKLSFSSVSINYFTRSVSLDSIQLVSAKNDKQYYYFAATNLQVKGIGIGNMLLNKKLNCQKLAVVEPVFEVYGNDGQKRDVLDKNELFNKLQPFFNKRLKNISIKDIELSKAKISHYKFAKDTTAFNAINNFNIGVINFYVDSAILAGHDELFNADEIYVKIVNFNRMLGDSLHRLHVDELTYSIKNKGISGSNIHLEPIDSITNTRTCYWINIPSLNLKSNDLRDILGNDTVKIDSLYLHQSNIRIRPPMNSKGINLRKLREFDLYELVKNDFNLVTIRHLLFEGQKLKIESRTNDPNAYQELKNIYVDIDRFQLDSTSYIQPDKVLYSDTFTLKVGSYLLRLNDQVHQFEASAISASSNDSLIRAEKIKLFPLIANSKLPVTVNLSCDSVRFLAVDLARLFHHREMPLQEVSAFKPNLSINQYKKAIEKDRDDNSLLYQFIGDYIKGVYANVIAIENGHFKINDLRTKADTGNIEANFNFRLTDFSLDSTSARRTDKLFFATNIELNFSNYHMKLADQLHELEVGKIEVSSIQRQATIKNLHLFPDPGVKPSELLKRLNRSEVYDIKVPFLYLRNTNIHHAFFRKNLNINNFSIIEPDIYLEVYANNKKQEKSSNSEEFYELLNNYITNIEIGKINAPNGKFRFVNHSKKGKTIDITNKFSLELEHFLLNDQELNKKRLLFSDFFELKLKDHLFKLSDNVHFLQASEIGISSRSSSVTISNALLYPDITSPDYKRLPWHLQVSVPQLQLNQVDLQKAYFRQILEVGDFQLKAPTIEIYQNGKSSGKVNFKDITVPLPQEMKELTFGKVELNNGKLKIYNLDRYNQKQVASSSIDFQIDQACLKRTENTKTAKFTSGSIETKLTRLHLTPEKVPYSIDVETINFSSNEKLLAFTNLDISANEKDDKSPLVRIEMPSLRFEELDPTDAFQNNRFHAQQILVTKPVFTLNSVDSEKTKNPLLISLPHDLQLVMDELSAGKVSVEDASFIINKNKKKKEHQHIDILLRNFELDSIQSEKSLGSEDVLISRNKVEFTDRKKYYNFLIDKISYSDNERKLSLSGINIEPRYSRNAFQKVIPYQADYYSGSIKSIDFTEIDLERWFFNQEFTGNQVLVNQADIEIYRDKQTRFNEKQRPPMPQKLIKEFDLPFYFDSVKLVNSNLTYSEQLENLPEPGFVKFSKLNCSVFPLTNLPYMINTTPNVTLQASGLLMDTSLLNVQMKFDMGSPAHKFTATGSLSPFEMNALNPITENNARIMVRSGQLNRFEFEFAADSVKAVGKLRFAYDDLKISILSQKDGDTKEDKFASFLANSLMLKSKNPRTRFLLPDEIKFERDQKRSILNYWWKTIFSGAKNTFGIKEDKE